MKKIAFFCSALAVVSLASCSSDEPMVEGNDKTLPTPVEGEGSFISFNIVTPAGTRAEDFENGEGNENAVKDATFLFFDAQGNATQTPQTQELTWTDGGTTTPAVEKISEATVVIAGNTQPTQVLVILNAPEGEDFSGWTLNDVLTKKIANYGSHDENTFIITNSVYQVSGKDVVATDITGKTFDTKEKALESPVDIYVERVVAKVTAENKLAGKISTTTVLGKTLTPEIQAIEVANIAEKSYLFKSLSGCGEWPTKPLGEWNDATNKRSYWATCPSPMTYDNKSYNEINGNLDNFTEYIQENTTGIKNASAVLVTAVLKDAAGKAVSFVEWGGNYYDTEAFKAQFATILKNAGYRVDTEATVGDRYVTIDEDEIRYLTAEEHEAYFEAGILKGWQMAAKLNVAKDTKLVKKVGDKYENVEDVEEINNFLLKSENLVKYWNEGKCYYFVNIAHDRVANVGVVRNHVYKLSLNSLKGLGTPVFNPGEDIIPEKPSDDLWYMAAKINILKWRILTQGVDFE